MNGPCFNIIYKYDNTIIPEIDDDELLQFSLAFMDILKRDYKPSKNKKVSSNSYNTSL